MGWLDLFGTPNSKGNKKNIKTVNKSKLVNKNTNKKSTNISKKKEENTKLKPEDKVAAIKEDFLKRQKEIENFKKKLNTFKAENNIKNEDDIKSDKNSGIQANKNKTNLSTNVKSDREIILKPSQQVIKIFDFIKNDLGKSLVLGISIDRQSNRINYSTDSNKIPQNLSKFEETLNKFLFEKTNLHLSEYLIARLKDNKIFYFQKLNDIDIVLLLDNDDINIGYILNVLKGKIKEI